MSTLYVRLGLSAYHFPRPYFKINFTGGPAVLEFLTTREANTRCDGTDSISTTSAYLLLHGPARLRSG